MKCLKQENNQQKPPQPKIQVQVFICTCRKQYNSFPALYLHNKNKHNITLRTKQKQKMKRHVVWSGNKKKLVYQFPQESDESCSFDDREQKQYKAFSQIKEARKKRQEFNSEEEIKNLRQIISYFLKFIQNDRIFVENSQTVILMFEKLIKYIEQTDKKIPLQILQNSHEKPQTRTQLLPFYLNEFIIKILPKFEVLIPQQNLIINFLSTLSNWMYYYNFSSYLAILNTNNITNFQIPIVKLESQNPQLSLIKIQSKDNKLESNLKLESNDILTNNPE